MILNHALPILLAVAAAAAAAQDFPQTFEHRFGTTVVEAAPERVVSLDYGGQDDLLALGVVPVGLRHWYGDHPFGTWPWAREALGNAEPALIRGEVNIEQVAALDPDLILAMASGITAEEYALLSRVAPVVAAEAAFGDFATPWQVRALTAGRATGRLAAAQAQVAAIDARLAAVRAAHPEWESLTATVAVHWGGAPSAFRSPDIRAQLLAQMGFGTPDVVDAAGEAGAFYATFSDEDPSALDADLLLWIDDGSSLAEIRGMALRRTLRAHVEGREAYAGALLSGALSFSSLLSLPFAIDRLVPQIEAAADGDPATPVPEAVAAGLAE